MRQYREKVVKLETYLMSQPRMLSVKQKMQNHLERGKTQTKEKLEKKKTEYILKLKIWRNLKKEEEKKLSGRKRKRKSPSSSSNVSSSDSTTDSKSEASATIKRFKVILKGEKFKWNLPSSMAQYVYHHFNAYIPDKNIKEELLIENPIPLNLQWVTPIDDLIRSLLSLQTVTTPDQRMERFHGETLVIMVPLSR